MESESTFDVDRRRLGHAWSCIIPAYIEMCKTESRKGPGVGVFRMASTTQIDATAEKDRTNCTFHYVLHESPFWETMLNDAPNRDALLSKYNPATHLMICVHIPAIEDQGASVGSFRLFDTTVNDESGHPTEVETV